MLTQVIYSCSGFRGRIRYTIPQQLFVNFCKNKYLLMFVVPLKYNSFLSFHDIDSLVHRVQPPKAITRRRGKQLVAGAVKASRTAKLNWKRSLTFPKKLKKASLDRVMVIGSLALSRLPSATCGFKIRIMPWKSEVKWSEEAYFFTFPICITRVIL